MCVCVCTQSPFVLIKLFAGVIDGRESDSQEGSFIGSALVEFESDRVNS